MLIPGDVRNEQFNYDLVKQAYNELGGLDNITLVAGHQQYHDDIHGFTTEHLLKHLKQMCIQFWTAQAATKYLKPGASITTTSSVQGYKPAVIL